MQNSSLEIDQNKFTIQKNETCDVYHNPVQAVCKGFVKFVSAAAMHERCRLARTLKLIVQTVQDEGSESLLALRALTRPAGGQ